MNQKNEIQNHVEAKEKNEPVEVPQSYRKPYYRVNESAERFELSVYVPGVSRESVDISLEKSTLTITATRKMTIPSDWKVLRQEIPSYAYQLALELNLPIQQSSITARVEDGILTLSLPKSEEIKPRKILVG